MKKNICLIFLLFLSSFLFSEKSIKEYSYFTIMGEIDLRNSNSFSEPVLYKSLNHEGGLKVKVMEIGNTETYNDETGKWFYILTTSPMWVDSGEWIEKYTNFWIFLPDSVQIFDYEEE